MAHAVAERALAFFDDLFPDEFRLDQIDPIEHRTYDILDEIRRFSAFGAATVQEQITGIPYYTNEFWTSGQRKGHSIHEVSYRACFKPQLPEFFIKRLTAPGDAVHDPFMGRGTTPIQAALMGRKPFANDINPLSKLLTRPRLAPPSVCEVDAFLANLPWDRPVEFREDLLAFYHPRTLNHLTVLKEELERRAPLEDESPNPIVDWVRMIAINRLTGHSPGFFSVYTLPPNQAVSVSAQLKINERRGQTPPLRDIRKIIVKKTRTLLKDGVPRAAAGACLLTGAADATSTIPPGSVSLVVTSPPFLDIVQYADDNWLRCWFAGIDSSGIQIAMHKSERAWEEMVKRVLVEQSRILKPGGHIAFEVGEVRGGKVLLERLVWNAAISLPFERLGVVVNQQEFTKTANCWGVSNNRGGTNTNRIVLLRRAGG
jgi:DNA methylase